MADKTTNKDRDRRIESLTRTVNNNVNMINALHDALEYVIDEVLDDEQRMTMIQRASAARAGEEEVPRILIPEGVIGKPN